MSNSDLKEIKKRIFNEDKIEKIFEAIGCERIKFEQGDTLLTAQLPDRFNSTNSRAVQCRLNEGLSCVIRNRNDFSGDIFNLVSYLKFDIRGDDLQSNLSNSKNFICKLFGWEYKKGTFKETVDILSGIKSMMNKNSRRTIKVNTTIPETTLEEYLMLPNTPWENEGISLETQETYGVGFDLATARITIPIRNKFGQLVGVKGRMFLDSEVTSYEPKYLYLHRCNQSYELFNLYIAINAIKKEKEIIIVEGEKSCMKFYENGIYNVVALGSSDLSPVQIQTIYSLGVDIKIVLAYDSDKTIEDVQAVAEKVDEREVSMIYDKDKKTGKKSAPIDSGIDIWNDLYQNYKYDLE